MAIPNHRWTGVGAVAVTVLAVGFVAFFTMTSGRRGRDVAVDQIAGYALATELLNRIGREDGRVVVATIRDIDSESESTRAAWKGFERKMKEAAPGVIRQTVNLLEMLRQTAGDRAAAMMFGEDGIPPFLFEQLMDANSNADAVVSLTGLPARYGQPQYPARGRPIVAALDLMFISGQSWAHLIRSGHLDFVILPRIQVDESSPERSPEQRFEKRFRLVTGENLDEAVKDYLEL